MGMFSMDENPFYLEKEFKLHRIEDIIQNKYLTNEDKILYIKRILFEKNIGENNNAK